MGSPAGFSPPATDTRPSQPIHVPLTAETVAVVVAEPSVSASLPAWKRLLRPSLSDFFFLAILVWLFLAGSSGWKALLMDGDTGWHIRAGEYMLQHGAIPAHDLFSYSKPGAPWFAWEWLSDVCFAILYGWAGLKAVVLFCGVLIAGYCTIVLRYALWRGANIAAALPLALLAAGSSSIHFLARPHLFTLVLLPAALWLLDADRRNPSWRVWLLIPVTAIWTNLHGGFAVLLVCIALALAGRLLERRFGEPTSRRPRAAWRYAGLLAACGLATLLNPYGFGLHAHIFQYLRSDWIRDLVQEFQAPTFRSEGQLQFELLLIVGLLLTGRLLRTRRFTEAFWILFFAHSSLMSVRHVPLYAAIAVPILASELTAMWLASGVSLAPRSVGGILFSLGRDLAPGFRYLSLWPAVAVAVIALINAPIAWPVDFPREAFPVALIARNQARLAQARAFTTDQWADYLIFHFDGRQKVFFDGRSDFYGEALGREYLSLMQGSSTAQGIIDKYRFDAVLIPVDWPLAAVLKSDGEWRAVDDDTKAILFLRRPAAAHNGADPAGFLAKAPNGISSFRRSK